MTELKVIQTLFPVPALVHQRKAMGICVGIVCKSYIILLQLSAFSGNLHFFFTIFAKKSIFDGRKLLLCRLEPVILFSNRCIEKKLKSARGTYLLMPALLSEQNTNKLLQIGANTADGTCWVQPYMVL